MAPASKFAVLGVPEIFDLEAEALERTTRLRQRSVIRQVSAIFDTRSLGYQSTLVAMRFAPGRMNLEKCPM